MWGACKTMSKIIWKKQNINDKLETIFITTINNIEIAIKKDYGGIWKVRYDKINSDDELRVIKWPKKIFLQKGLKSDDDILKYLKEESVKNLNYEK